MKPTAEPIGMPCNGRRSGAEPGSPHGPIPRDAALRRGIPTLISLGLLACVVPALLGASAWTSASAPRQLGQYVVFAQNDLGMHCMQRDYSRFMILPPSNTVNAWVYERGESPQPITELQNGRVLTIHVPGNTRSADKTNWWRHAESILGQAFAPDIGLTGNGLAGEFELLGQGLFEFAGMPITPLDDAGRNNPYPLASVEFTQGGQVLASAQTVVPVSWELRCDLCHGEPSPGLDSDLDILRDHDRLHGTTLEASQPVFCAGCHADAALGAPGEPGVSVFSHAMHASHADRLGDLPVTLATECYACHPGERAQCQRDVHSAMGMNCNDCHGGMADVGDPSRMPWVDEPRCADCHSRPGFEFEPPGVLFRNARGHGGVACVVCHGSPHAVTPTVTEADNLQHLSLQGHTGTLDTCTVCHIEQPHDPFPHRGDD
jgi:hypothetical protein